MLLEENNDLRDQTNVSLWHKDGYTGKGVHVVIFDTKATPHEHMPYALSPLVSEPRISHGTNVAQCIHEFAPDAKITMLYSTSKAREWFREHAHTVDLVNISMSALKTLAEHSWGFLEEYDIPVICSSGNQSDDDVAYPSAFDWTISVGAYEDYRDSVASYSNSGEKLDCVGFTNITVPGAKDSLGNQLYLTFNGTSAAAPCVTGLLACYKQFSGELSREQAFNFVRTSVTDVESEGFDLKSGHGLFILPKERGSKMKLISLDELLDLLDKYSHSELHVHHTWKPNHADFTGSNHIRLQEGMRNYHVNTNGWSDIAQHVTLFPDGKFVTGRDFGTNPASIIGQNGTENKVPFMVEMIGNFDVGNDELKGDQLKSIMALAKYFDGKGRYVRFHNENAGKSCPGTGIDKDKFMADVRKPAAPKLNWKEEAVKWMLDEGYLTDESWLNKVDDPFPLWAQAIVFKRIIERMK